MDTSQPRSCKSTGTFEGTWERNKEHNKVVESTEHATHCHTSKVLRCFSCSLLERLELRSCSLLSLLPPQIGSTCEVPEPGSCCQLMGSKPSQEILESLAIPRSTKHDPPKTARPDPLGGSSEVARGLIERFSEQGRSSKDCQEVRSSMIFPPQRT